MFFKRVISNVHKYTIDKIKNFNFKRLLQNLLFTSIMFSTLILPDFIFKMLGKSDVVFDDAFMLRFLGLCILFSFCKSKIFYFFFIGLLFILENIQLHTVVYFGSPISVGQISNIIKEKSDVFDLQYLKQVWFVFPTLLILYTLNSISFLKISKRYKTNIAIILTLPVLLRFPEHAYFNRKSVNYFNSSSANHSISNTNKTFSYYFFGYLKKVDKKTINIKFEPYTIEKNEVDEDQNIFVIMGESMASKHMSLYGYERETTPKLDNMSKTEENFQISQGLSSSICTGTSFLLFFNVIGEVGNNDEINNKTANLFKLAKSKGFSTYYISAQENALLTDIVAKHIDHITTKDTASIMFRLHKDEALIKILKGLDLEKNKKNFVVINLRAPHSPYIRRYKHQKKKYDKFEVTKKTDDKTYRINTYDNAMLYADNVIVDLINTMKEKSENSYHIFLTSDHGELFGENGMWGHSHLVMEDVKVPFIMISNKKLQKLPPIVSHYDIGKMIIRQLGYELKNKNEEEGIRYIFAVDLNGNYEFIKYKIDGNEIKDLGKNNIREYYKLTKPDGTF